MLNKTHLCSIGKVNKVCSFCSESEQWQQKNVGCILISLTIAADSKCKERKKLNSFEPSHFLHIISLTKTHCSQYLVFDTKNCNDGFEK